MTQTFDCPKCGAPLSFEPRPGDETVECPYCHATVIIPKELSIPLPPEVVQWQPHPERSKRLAWVIVAFVSVMVITVCVVIILIANPSNQSTTDLSTENASFESGSITATALSAVDSATATIEAKATIDALQSILKLEQSWPTSFTDTFTDGSHNWLTGDVRNSYISGNRSINSGTYTWNITTVQSASDFSFPTMPDQQDFYASVDMKLVSMPDDPDADAGMVFRYNSTDQTWYYFSVNDQGQYYFGWFDGTDWYSLIPETDSTVIHPGQTNRLTVGVQGSQFIFLINGQMVDHFIDVNLKSGTIGVGINLPQTGQKAIVEFANFTVLSTSPNP